MNPKEILEKIVSENGSCAFSNPDICSKCPMSQLKFRDDGNPLSCVDALNAGDVTIEEADALYKDAAKRILAELSIEEIIEED